MSLFSFSKLEAPTMRDLLLHELADLHSAETQLLKALPDMSKAATNGELQEAFMHHTEETKNHVQRLEQCFSLLNEDIRTKTCQGMEGLIAEGKHVLEGNVKGSVKDAALIATAQRIEHYEIAAYGCAHAFAKQLNLPDVAELLDDTLAEEKATDTLLTQIADSINEKAPAGVAA